MDGGDRPIWFAGDLADPWVAAIAAGLPAGSRRIDCPGSLPDPWPLDGPTPGVLVVHRANLDATDAQRLARLRARADATPRVVLCVGPQARHADLERWARLVDAVVPEASAAGVVLRHALGVEAPARPVDPGRPVAVISTSFEVRAMVAEACRSGGYEPEGTADGPPPVATIWDVPMLDPGWPGRLARRAAAGPVVALMGFADRRSVAAACRAGASACLELPFEPVDLILALDRAAIDPIGSMAPVPPPPMGLRAPGRARRAGSMADRGASS